MKEMMAVRTDRETGDMELCDLDTAEQVIRNCYKDVGAVMKQFAFGHPIRCSFSTFQHRDFVPGYERKESK